MCDFQGFGFGDCNVGMIVQCVDIFGKHYPARKRRDTQHTPRKQPLRLLSSRRRASAPPFPPCCARAAARTRPHAPSPPPLSFVPQETLNGIYVVGAPRLWDLFWPTLNAAIRMSFASVAKVHFVKAPDGSGAGDPFRSTLMHLFDEELVLWMVEEMNENRDSSVSDKKLGWLAAVREGNGVTRNGSKAR